MLEMLLWHLGVCFCSSQILEDICRSMPYCVVSVREVARYCIFTSDYILYCVLALTASSTPNPSLCLSANLSFFALSVGKGGTLVEVIFDLFLLSFISTVHTATSLKSVTKSLVEKLHRHRAQICHSPASLSRCVID